MTRKKAEHKILNAIKKLKEPNILSIATATKMDRHTVAKYLEVLKTKGLATYQTKGKSKIWKIEQNSFSEILGVNDFITSQVLDIVKNLEYEVSIQTKNYDVIWHNSHEKKGKCYEIKQGKKTPCKKCPAEKVFKTGKTEKITITQNNEERTVIAEPIKNEEGKVIAIIELAKIKGK